MACQNHCGAALSGGDVGTGPSCASSSHGCLRCDFIPEGKFAPGTSAILFGSRDNDACETLKQFLKNVGKGFQNLGSLLLVTADRAEILALAAQMTSGLSAYTQSCIHAVYAPKVPTDLDQALSLMIFAAPLAQMIDGMQHEWVRRALADNWLFSVFHPILDATSGSVVANEALLRAADPQDGKVLGAGQIIKACESLNLLHQLDQRARQSAIRAGSLHLPCNGKLFINFLPNTIYDPEICLRTTMEAARQYNLSMDRLVFEVVETEKIPDMNHLSKVLSYYRDRGVGTAIDDMGAGFTSAEYILSLQPDFVKLDRDFVLEAEKSRIGRRAMDSIISTSHANHARVIAEGIETIEQMRLCVESGVDLLQGFLFAKPACPPQQVLFPRYTRTAA